MIHVENLHKKFGDLHAVDGISFDVADGELFGFLGPNGAGKTTTLSMLCGLLKPDSGLVTVDEVDVWQQPLMAKRLMGLVPQDLALYEELSARENLHFWGSLYNLSKAEIKQNTDELLERVGLEDRAKEPVSRFSGGMKRRLNLAIGLVHKPRMILLDEPTVGIDPQARNNILEIVRNISNEGTTVLFTTHHLEEAEALCERIAIMDHGKILSTGSLEELARIAGDYDIAELHGDFSITKFKDAIDQQDVQILDVKEGKASVSLMNNTAGLAPVIQSLSEAGIVIHDLTIQKPNLEKVFLKLTGRELRD